MSEPKKNFPTEQEAVTIPFFVHEAAVSRLERIIKRIVILAIIIFVAFVGTNAGWIIYNSQFETYTVEQEVDTGNGAAYVAGVGDVNYGEGLSENNGSGEENQLEKPDENMP